MGTPKQRPLVVIEDSLLQAMATNADIRREFPFLAAATRAQPRSTGCGSCSRRTATQNAVISRVKQQLAGLDDSKKRRLKDLLNARQVRVTYRHGNKIRQLTF